MENFKKFGHGLHGSIKGQAGVYAVAAQLLLRGIVPFFPAVDQGCDIILENGIRLQVKTSHLSYGKPFSRLVDYNIGSRGGKTVRTNYPDGAYCFNLRRAIWDRTQNRPSRKFHRSYKGVADFFVLWGIDENRFWVVRTNVKNSNMWFGRLGSPNGSNNLSHTDSLKAQRNLEMENRWDLLDVDTVKSLIQSAECIPSLQEKA